MNKKIALFISICLSVCMFVPCRTVKAYSDNFKVYTTDSVLSNYTGTFTGPRGSVDIATEASNLYRLSSSWTGFQTLDTVYDNIPFTNNSFLYAIDSTDNVSSFRYVTFTSTAPVIVVYGQGAKSSCYAASTSPFSFSMYTCDSNTGQWSINRSGSSSVPTNYAFDGVYVTDFNTQLYSLLDFSDISFYCNQEWGTYSPNDPYTGMCSSILMHDNEHDFTNFVSEDYDYFNGDSIVSPDDGTETNKNHMYFTSCDFGFCEPVNVNSFSNFGGAYFYIKYGVDSWVLDHIGDYKIEFNVVCYVGSERYSFTTRQALDPDMILTIPFSYFDGFNYGFSAYVTNNKIDNTFLKTYLYSVPSAQYNNFFNSITSGSSEGSLSSALNKLLYTSSANGFLTYVDDSSTTVINSSVLDTNFLNRIYYNNNYSFTLNARLIDESGNQSGLVSREFDIVRGSSTSIDNDGLTNDNPFVDNSEDNLPYVPDDYEVVGSNTTNGVSVYNMTPNDIKLTIDNGLKDFVSWYNTDESVGNAAHSFWNNMGIFEDNPASSLYEQYFGFLPDDFKNLIFGACGIGIVGGAFCILRKKLT